MPSPVPVSVGIPTFSRGERVFEPIARVLACDPPPAEIIVHVDASDGCLERKLADTHPQVRIISSPCQVGPGGGRNRCIRAASHEIFASFDDDSWPVDSDYFARLVRHAQGAPENACFAAVVTQKNDPRLPSSDSTSVATDFTGCGYGLRVSVYRKLFGFVDRPFAYGLEERDVALQLHDAGYRVLRCHDLRVFHDSDLGHHGGAEIVAATIQNAALLAWLRYPVSLWAYGVLQFANVIWFMLRRGRLAGILGGLLGTPGALWAFRKHRQLLSERGIRSYLKARRSIVKEVA